MEKNTQNRPGYLTQNDRSETFVCLQTWHINRCERFCQDPVEEYFGIQK